MTAGRHSLVFHDHVGGYDAASPTHKSLIDHATSLPKILGSWIRPNRLDASMLAESQEESDP